MTGKINIKNRLGIYLYIFFAGLISTVTMRTVACFRDLDFSSGYFDDKGLIIAANITVVAFMLVLFLHTFSHTVKDSMPKEDFSSSATYIPLGGLAVSVLFLVVDLISDLWTSSSTLTTVPGIVKLVCTVFGLLSIVTFVLNILIESRLSQLRGVFSIITVLFFALYSINVYFSTDMPANSPSKILTEFAFLFTAIFFLYETRISIGHSKWHSYTAFGLIATLLLSYTAIPAIIIYAINDGVLLARSTVELAACLCLALFIGARTLLIAFAPEDEPCELADGVMDMVYERQKENENSLAREFILNVENPSKSSDPSAENEGIVEDRED